MTAQFPYPAKLYQPLNRCAYCPSDVQLSTEHIISYGLGGELIFPKASCESCRKATSKVEDFILRKYLCALRSHLSLPSRNPAGRPDGYKLKLSKNGRPPWTQKVPLSKHPGDVRFVMFDPPGHVVGRPVNHPTYNVRLVTGRIFSDWENRLRALGADGAEDKVAVNAMALARIIAKIGHSYAIAELGFGAFEETYVNHLVKAEAADWHHWVGGYDRRRIVEPVALHELKFLRRGQDLSTIVHLFIPYCPTDAYEVVVGRLRPGFDLPPELRLE
jgi:hypothetical protein